MVKIQERTGERGGRGRCRGATILRERKVRQFKDRSGRWWVIVDGTRRIGPNTQRESVMLYKALRDHFKREAEYEREYSRSLQT